MRWSVAQVYALTPATRRGNIVAFYARQLGYVPKQPYFKIIDKLEALRSRSAGFSALGLTAVTSPVYSDPDPTFMYMLQLSTFIIRHRKLNRN